MLNIVVFSIMVKYSCFEHVDGLFYVVLQLQNHH